MLFFIIAQFGGVNYITNFDNGENWFVWSIIMKKGFPIARKAHKINIIFNYSTIVATRPEPTVRPPSRSDWT